MPLVAKKTKDRHYNTPRAWAIQRFLNPEIEQDPRSFEIPWCQKPYRKVTIEDVKYVLSNHYQDTIYDPYGPEGDHVSQRTFRTIGINRTSQTAILQLRPNKPQETTRHPMDFLWLHALQYSRSFLYPSGYNTRLLCQYDG